MMLNAKGVSQDEQEHREHLQIDPDTLREIQKAKDMMAVIGSLQRRIEGHLGQVFKGAVRTKDPEYLRLVIDELPEGFHKNEMKKYLHTLEHGKPQDDDFYQE